MGFAQNALICDIILGQSPKQNINFVKDFLDKFQIGYIFRKLKLNVNMAAFFLRLGINVATCKYKKNPGCKD